MLRKIELRSDTSSRKKENRNYQLINLNKWINERSLAQTYVNELIILPSLKIFLFSFGSFTKIPFLCPLLTL